MRIYVCFLFKFVACFRCLLFCYFLPSMHTVFVISKYVSPSLSISPLPFSFVILYGTLITELISTRLSFFEDCPDNRYCSGQSVEKWTSLRRIYCNACTAVVTQNVEIMYRCRDQEMPSVWWRRWKHRDCRMPWQRAMPSATTHKPFVYWTERFCQVIGMSPPASACCCPAACARSKLR